MIKYNLSVSSIYELGKRESQQDAIYPEMGKSTGSDHLFIVCDGMGGHARGEVASATVCDVVSSYILKRWSPDKPLDDKLINDAINAAIDRLDRLDGGEAKKMGTTLALVAFHAGGVTVAHIGDSRVYHLRGGSEPKVMYKTRDHSLVNDLVAIGDITEREAKTHPQRNVITRAIMPNQERRVKAEIAHISGTSPGDVFFMCSDGMLEQMNDDNILDVMFEKGLSDAKRVKLLRKATADNRDNHSAHIIRVMRNPDEPYVDKSSLIVVAGILLIAIILLLKPANNNKKSVPQLDENSTKALLFTGSQEDNEEEGFLKQWSVNDKDDKDDKDDN